MTGPWVLGSGDLMDRELRIGQQIQQGFLPAELPCPDGWDVASCLYPARMVAGDFYDGFELANGRRIAYLVADVCDKGVGAALFMALIRTLLRHTALSGGAGAVHPSDLEVIGHAGSTAEVGEAPAAGTALASGSAPLLASVRGTNDYLLSTHREQGYFATVFFAVLDPVSGRLTYANCGHNPPYVLRRSGPAQRLTLTGPAIGMLPGASFGLGQVTLGEGDTLLAYTDGVTEAQDADGAFFTDDRLAELLVKPVESAAEVLARVDAAVRGFAGAAEQHDDITLLAVHRGA